MIPLGNAASIFGANSAVTLMMSKCFLDEKVGLPQVFLLMVVIGGVTLITKPSFLFGGDDGAEAGIGYLLAVSACAL
jgi:drug/metabolite transporter (DMT)-like permease